MRIRSSLCAVHVPRLHAFLSQPLTEVVASVAAYGGGGLRTYP